MNKKIIIITAAAGLVSFAGSFILAWLTKKAPQPQNLDTKQPIVADAGRTGQEVGQPPLQPEATTASGLGFAGGETKISATEKAMTEKQLNTLIYEVREKTREYNAKLKDLEQYEQRLRLTEDMLKKDNEELNNLRIELTSIVTSLKNERDKLLKSRIEIAQTEKANLMVIAAAYDKMDPAGASKILTNMSQSQSNSPGGGSNFDDAVKILYYMTERTKAKLLVELATSEPALAAHLSQKLKQVIEKE
jgi:flagellar motility protein MotE (MotC chaperone)